jgi:hypothetical protein
MVGGRRNRDMKPVMAIFLVCGTAILLAAPLPAGDDGNPHAPNAMHPDEVAQIMKLLPQIEATDFFDKIIGMLGLPKDWDGGSVSSTHCTMVWRKLAPGYHFALNFDPVVKDGKIRLVFTEASFSAQKKPGLPPDEYHTIYPYRSWKGMVHK